MSVRKEKKEEDGLYEIIDVLSDKQHVFLVRNKLYNTLYVKKILDIYSLDVYLYLKEHHIRNTPIIYEVKENEEKLEVLEQYIQGSSLEEILEEQGTLDKKIAADYVKQLCRIVRDLHLCSPPIIHRDIKPENILVTEGGIVKLLDMNAAKFFDQNGSRDTYLLGTYGYAAPEQYGFGKASVLSDIYGIGKVLHVLLAGSLEKQYDGELSYVIDKCTKLDPKYRYQNIDELLFDLNQVKTVKEVDYSKLPGFRTGNKLQKAFAIVAYASLALLTARAEVDDVESTWELWLYRIMAFAVMMGIFLFHRNYKHVWDLTGLSEVTDRKRRRKVLLIYDVGILFVTIFALQAASYVFNKLWEVVLHVTG